MSGFELHGSTYIQCSAIRIYCHTNDSLQCWSDLIGSEPCVFQEDNNTKNEKGDNAARRYSENGCTVNQIPNCPLNYQINI